MTEDWVEVPFLVQAPSDGLRVDAFLAARLHRYSRAQVQRLIADGRVRRERPGGRSPRAAKAALKVAKGDTVVVRYPRRPEPPARHESLEVLYEDEALVAVNKPGDVLSHPTDRVTANSATSILKGQFGRAFHLVHRLDRETSGVLLFAKDPGAARDLAGQFARRGVRKEYLALVRGRTDFETLVVDRPLGREGGAIKVRQSVAGESASAAVTELVTLARGRDRSLVSARPRTGRLHQIRVHLAWLGHPVLGDKLYFGEGEAYMKAVRKELVAADVALLGAERQLLHAWRLELAHPATGARLVIEAPPPPDFARAAAGLLDRRAALL